MLILVLIKAMKFGEVVAGMCNEFNFLLYFINFQVR